MKITKYNHDWKFWEVTNSFALNWAPPEEAKIVELPHDVMIETPQDPAARAGANTGYRKGGVYSYSHSFCPASPDRTYMLKIEGAASNVFVYVNGQLAAKRPYGYSVFYVPLNKYLDYSGENEIRIQVRSGAEPNSRWYPGAGLYRDVYLLEAGTQYIKPDSVQIRTVRVPGVSDVSSVSAAATVANTPTAHVAGIQPGLATPSANAGMQPSPAAQTPIYGTAAAPSAGTFTVKTDLNSKGWHDSQTATIRVNAIIACQSEEKPGSLEITITDATGKLAATASVPINSNPVSDTSATALACSELMQGSEEIEGPDIRYYPVDTELSILNPHLWSAEEPNLYTCHLTLKGAMGATLDTHEDTFGIRTLSVSPAEGLRVNGKEVKLRGACIHHDSGILGTKTYEGTHIRQIRILKEAGFNAIRCAHNPAAPALLRACDKVGMYVMDESFDMWTRHKSDYDYAMNFEEWWDADIEAMVRNDFNHPAVIMYSIGNEIPEIGTPQGGRISKMLCEKIRSLDDTRFTLASVNGLFSVGDGLDKIISDVVSDLSAQGKLDGNVNDFMAFMHTYMNDMTNHPIVDQAISVPFQHTDIAGYNYMGSRYEIDGALHPERVIVGSESGIAEICQNWEQVMKYPYLIGDFCWTGWEYLGEAGIGSPNYEGGSNPFGNAAFPLQISGTGCIDITGFRLPMSYFREIVFGLRKDPYIAIQDPAHYGEELIRNPWIISDVISSWSWKDHIGKPVVIEVYSNAEEVELFKDGVSLGRKMSGAATEYVAYFETTYEPGVLTAISYGKDLNAVPCETGRYELRSAGEGLHLKIAEEPACSAEIPVPEDPVSDAGLPLPEEPKPEKETNIFLGPDGCFSQNTSTGIFNLDAVAQSGRINASGPVGSAPAGTPVAGSSANPGIYGGSDIGNNPEVLDGLDARQGLDTSGDLGTCGDLNACNAPNACGDPNACEDHLHYLTITVEDENGVLAADQDMEIQLSTDDNVRILGFGSADPKPTHNYTESVTRTYRGRAQLIVLKKDEAAPANVMVRSDSGLKASFEI